MKQQKFQDDKEHCPEKSKMYLLVAAIFRLILVNT